MTCLLKLSVELLLIFTRSIYPELFGRLNPPSNHFDILKGYRKFNDKASKEVLEVFTSIDAEVLHTSSTIIK